MTVTFHCGDNEALVGYMYDEGEPGERAAIAAHVATCASCAGELAALGATREGLAAWTPPDVPLGFRIVSEPPAQVVSLEERRQAVPGDTERRQAVPADNKERRQAVPADGAWWQRPMPAWAQAAAAAMIFAAGLGLGAMRGGSVEPAGAVATTAAPATASAPATTVSAQDLRALEQRLLAQVAQARPAGAAAAAAPQVAGTTNLTMQQVQSLIAESEQRQQRELTLRTAEVIRDFDTQRRGDLARIQQTFGRLEGTTGAEAEQQRQMLNYLMRVSQRPQ